MRNGIENKTATVRWVRKTFQRQTFSTKSLRNILDKKDEILSWAGQADRTTILTRSDQSSGHYPKAETAWAAAVREQRQLGFPYTKNLIQEHWVR